MTLCRFGVDRLRCFVYFNKWPDFNSWITRYSRICQYHLVYLLIQIFDLGRFEKLVSSLFTDTSCY